ncbi:MAG: type II toxin-antitoxin system HicB family antitoxin [Mycobacteriales bacterium]
MRTHGEGGGAVQVESTVTVDVRYEPDDELYIAEVRELQGCWASGKNRDELMHNLQGAIAEYYEVFQDQEVVEMTFGTPMPADAENASEHAEVRVLAGAS